MMNEIDNVAPDVSQDNLAHNLEGDVSLWASFIAAVQFLTRLPLATETPVSPKALHRSAVFFPLVAAFLGIFTAVFIGVGCLVWPLWLAVLIALAAEMRLTGALHEDAVADFCDAFGGGWTREEVLMILKDSRIGAYGALGLFVAVSLRAAATIAIVSRCGIDNPWVWGSAVVASSTIGRGVMVIAMVYVPTLPRRESLARDFGHRLTARDLLLAGFAGIPFAVPFAYLQPWRCLAAVLLITPTVSWMLFRVKRQLGGITGDCLGCIGYVSHVLVLLAAAMRSESWSSL